jgi:hypothetical protein
VTDLERFVYQIINNLAATDPDRLRQPLRLAEIRRSILPYRANRRALQLQSSEDYELMLMRLCAGDGGFARTDPDEVQAEFAAEIRSPNPDLSMVDRHENARVTLEPKSLARALGPAPELAFAPPAEVPEPKDGRGPGLGTDSPPPKASQPTAPPDRAPDKLVRCSRCGNSLPTGRVVNFCPQCGQNLMRICCPECRTVLEPGWRHCVSCGAAVDND